MTSDATPGNALRSTSFITSMLALASFGAANVAQAQQEPTAPAELPAAPGDNAPPAQIHSQGTAHSLSDAPAPPAAVFGENRFLKRWPGYDSPDRRNIKALDFGFAASGRSPFGYWGDKTLFYLDVGAAYGNKYVYLEGRSMGLFVLLDGLIGLTMMNLNLMQSDDFPPFVRMFNDTPGQGVWELANGYLGYVVATDARRSWGLGFQSHLTVVGGLDGQAYLLLGGAMAGQHSWYSPLFDVTLQVYGGPEVGATFGGYLGTSLTWRRAAAQGFAWFVRWSTTGHLLYLLPPAFSGMVEAGISFGNWK